MPKVNVSIEILSPPATVWRVVSDATFVTKLYPDVVTFELDPPGKVAVGKKIKLAVRVARLRAVAVIQITRLDDQVCLESKGAPGGFFDVFHQLVTLTADGWGTRANIEFAYTILPEYASKVPDPALLEKALGDNFRAYARNLKDISELLPLPE